MANMTHGCKWAVVAAASIWLGVVAVAGTAQARVVLLEGPYNPGQQVAVEFKGCISEAQLEKLLPILKQRQTADLPPATRIVMASPARAARFSPPLMVGVAY